MLVKPYIIHGRVDTAHFDIDLECHIVEILRNSAVRVYSVEVRLQIAIAGVHYLVIRGLGCPDFAANDNLR